jgi:putative transposase
MAVNFKGAHFPQDIILTGIRWYVAYPLSTRHVEELMGERGVEVDHSTINRWVVKYSSQLREALHRRKRAVGRSWRMDETYIKIKGEWYYLYRAVDKSGQTIDFLLTQQRDEPAAKRFLTQAIRRHGVPEKVTFDGSEANAAAIRSYNAEHGTAIDIRPIKYLNNIIEQDHRGVKRITRPMLGFKSFDAGAVNSRRYRTHAHAQETATGARRRKRGPHGGRTILRTGRLIPSTDKGSCPFMTF